MTTSRSDMGQAPDASAAAPAGEDLANAMSVARAEVAPTMRDPFDRFCLALFERLAEAGRGGIPSATLAAIARQAFVAAGRRRSGDRVVEITSGYASGDVDTGLPVSLLLVLGDDEPFLVSSVAADVLANGARPLLVLHPVLHVVRDGDGNLLDVRARTAGAKAEHPAGGGRAGDESLIVFVIAGLDAAASDALVTSLRTTLADVDAAVSDWPRMLARLDTAIVGLEERAIAAPAGLLGETIAFCRWMREGQFVLLGMREYRLDGEPETADLAVVPGSGLGILADPSVHVLRRGRELVALNDEVRRFYLQPAPIIITKSNVVSRVHRRVHMDYVGLKTYHGDGRLAGELRIVGLFTAAAYTAPPAEIPFLRLKAEEVFAAAGIDKRSHEGRVLQHIIDTFPRDELFQIGVRQLASWAPALLQLEFDPRIRVFVRRDRFDRFVSALVFVPRDRFSTQVRETIGDMLAARFNGRMVAFQPYFTAGPLVRVHFIVGRYEGDTPDVPEGELEEAVRAIAATWQDRLDAHLATVAEGHERYGAAFPLSYAENFPPERALEDMARIGRLSDETPVAIDFYGDGEGVNAVRLAIYRFDAPIPLSDRVPLLENLGFAAIDERTYEITPRFDAGERTVFLHDMQLRTFDGREIDIVRIDAQLEECFVAVFNGRAENDAFNRLVMVAQCDWREAAMLRGYAAFMRQLGLPFSPRYVAETLARHASRARDLVRLFKTRLDPGSPAGESERGQREADLRMEFESALSDVQSLDEDRILRTLMGLVTATVRTNFFMCDEHGNVPATIAFKLASGDIAEAPQPRPYREIFVTSPEVDGVHLRFAPVSRGGIRWSDRAQDFRTEVLGLAKAQQVKNTVIVPQGAKGGFVVKRAPMQANRDDILKGGIAAYRAFVSSLLDITDNLDAGTPLPPSGVVRRDGDDAYLVVAADKGTATFSDIANGISAEHGFWLDDAFASGGSAGYDHKKMGITARGAWECVKRHFREMDHDIQNEPFRVIGVGDMSGDVFGNGMLLSRHIRLAAAFDHRDIFLDPDPDAARSFAERERMFALPRSSWQDYDRSTLSKGGGVFSRSAKAIDLSPEVKALLAVDTDRMTPAALINAILKAEADLLWLGGIGTYVRGDHEADAEAGDRANDAVRIAARDLKVRVVGEGANLGLTQRARIDAAASGVRLNTDFIDNSAGVNSSDQEVNIKIALSGALRDGRLTRERRNELLSSMTSDVAAACLENNAAQSLAISLEERLGSAGIPGAMLLMHRLEQRGILDRALQGLPDDAALRQRRAGGSGMTRPEIAVLLSHAKLALSHDLVASGAPDDPANVRFLTEYFPPALREAYAADIAAHPLRREIITTELTNRIVNICGAELPSRLTTDWSMGVDGMGTSALAALEIVGVDRLLAQIAAYDNRIGGALQLSLYAEVREAARRQAGWIAAHVRQVGTQAEIVARQKAVLATLASSLPDVLTERRQAAYQQDSARRLAEGAPAEIASDLAVLHALRELGDISLACPAGTKSSDDVKVIAKAYFVAGDELRISELKDAAGELDAADRYDRLAINSAVSVLSATHREVAREVRRAGSFAAWRDGSAGAVEQLEARLADIVDGSPLSIARLTVASAALREMAEHARPA